MVSIENFPIEFFNQSPLMTSFDCSLAMIYEEELCHPKATSKSEDGGSSLVNGQESFTKSKFQSFDTFEYTQNLKNSTSSSLKNGLRLDHQRRLMA